MEAGTILHLDVPNAAIFKKMMALPDSHENKAFKIPVEKFQASVGYPRGEVRYATLFLQGENVNVAWSPEEGTFKVSGKYGK
jgi:hypothetical protein